MTPRPAFETIRKVMGALGIRLHAEAVRGNRKTAHVAGRRQGGAAAATPVRSAHRWA
jgi:hypothetical protein